MRPLLCLASLPAAALATLPAAAALPPNYQRAAELNAVIGQAARVFGTNAPIERVEYLRPDLYRATAGRCHVDVAIIGLPNPQRTRGPRRFEARPGERVCAAR